MKVSVTEFNPPPIHPPREYTVAINLTEAEFAVFKVMMDVAVQKTGMSDVTSIYPSGVYPKFYKDNDVEGLLRKLKFCVNEELELDSL